MSNSSWTGVSGRVVKLLFLIAGVLVVGAVSAATIYVDVSNQSPFVDGSLANPYRSIRAALLAASSGDQVRVAAGTYYETISVPDGVSLFGEDPQTTIIDGTGQQDSVVVFNGTRQSPRFNGFTVTGGEGDRKGEIAGVPLTVGGGIYIVDSSPLITNTIITGNSVTEGITRGAGIYVNTAVLGYTPQIIGNVISYNNVVSADQDDQGEGGGIYVNTKLGSVIISDNLIDMNQARSGGGIFSQNTGTATAFVQRNVLRDNQADDGAAILTRDFPGSASTIVNNLVIGNGSASLGTRDCDDGEATSAPGMTEICNDGIDNDCNPATPDLFDADGDGSPCHLDCDDSDPSRSPLAAEHCTDQVDNDCDGAVDLAAPENIVMVEFGTSMRYLANASDPGVGVTWVETTFNDAGWSDGTFGVGFELSSGGAHDLIETDVGSDVGSVYSRVEFEVPLVTEVNALFLGADYDDGYVVWINGTEVYRSPEMPVGAPAWDEGPSSHESSNGATPDYGTLIDISSAGIPLLVDGTNLMAVGVYQDYPAANSDLVIVPRLSMSYGLDDADCTCADGDGDGYAGGACAVDCNDGDPTIHPAQPEICNDAIDNDCNAGTPDIVDADNDLFNCALDCDDNNPAIRPSALEVLCDGVDNDCNVNTLDLGDADSDQFACDVDCDDLNPSIKPDAVEFCFDGIDNNCDGFVDGSDDECSCPSPIDLDSDGFRCTDCNDGDPAVNPAANEICNDLKDNDCSAQTPDIFDGDGDGELCDVDCLDTDAAVNTAAIEICNDGIDNDCDTLQDALDPDCQGCPDLDGDGYPGGTCAVDCDDALPEVNPGLDEVCNDGLDNDCDPVTLDIDDVDGDGFACDVDCNDGDPAVNSGVYEACNDLIDNDCDGSIDLLNPDLVLVEFGSPMRFLAGDSDPGIGIGWTAESFDDAPWTNGIYGVGYQVGPPGSGAENLIALEVFEGASFVYTRARFTITDVAGVNALSLGADYDDAYVAWINGVEVYRSPEMPAGTPVWNADPTLHESSNDLVPDYGTLIDISGTGIAALHEGTNTLAVGIYNDFPELGGYSSDLVLVPRLAMSFGSDDDDCACEDLDGDGYVGGACGIDCDDTELLVHPDQPEIGCDGLDNDCDPATLDGVDGDGDGAGCDVDCDDFDPEVYPGNVEITCDFIDNDCDNFTSDIEDADGDTYDCYLDCDDSTNLVSPSAPEVPCDGIDNDCSTLTADIQDVDGDGYFCDVDCDENETAINPAAAEHCTDTFDNDCDGDTDDVDLDCNGCPDVDGDGYAGGACAVDCDDAVAATNPGVAEVCNDGIDNDCDPGTIDLIDADADGDDCLVDCDDADPTTGPSLPEICGDTLDNDCNAGTPDVFDGDADTHLCDVDCDDGDPEIYPGATEICADAVDNDCDVATVDLFDLDLDTFVCSFDCNDDDDLVNPAAVEVCNDLIDNDCNAATPDIFDEDGDGSSCELDCDDADGTRSTVFAEECTDGIDNDCDGDVDDADADCNGCPDVDGDGYAGGACAVDCDDSLPGVNPGQPEICGDTLDNDCNPATVDIADVDGDGYSCDVDCDDGSAGINPGAAEICGDALDNDCNVGTPDLLDVDNDTYLCDVDCDDDNQAINPGRPEIGCDGIDNDCDGATPDLADADADGVYCIDVTLRGAGISSIAYGDATITIVNNTIVQNDVVAGIGGGIWVDDLQSTAPGLVANNVVVDNVAEIAGGVEYSAFFGELKNNAVHGNVGGDFYNGAGSGATRSGNLLVDPRLASPSSGNYRLAPDSPAIDAGDPASAPLNDIDRFWRPFDGDGDLVDLPDIGAYEYPSGEVFNLVFTGTHTLSWDVRAQDPAYSLYRGNLRILRLQGVYTQNPSGASADQFCGISAGAVPYTDNFLPGNDALFYIVTVSGAVFEGSLGEDSEGRIRINDYPCP